MGSHFLFQTIFLTRRSNPGLPRCRQIFYHLSHQGSPIKDTTLTKHWIQILLPPLFNCVTWILPLVKGGSWYPPQRVVVSIKWDSMCWVDNSTLKALSLWSLLPRVAHPGSAGLSFKPRCMLLVLSAQSFVSSQPIFKQTGPRGLFQVCCNKRAELAGSRSAFLIVYVSVCVCARALRIWNELAVLSYSSQHRMGHMRWLWTSLKMALYYIFGPCDHCTCVLRSPSLTCHYGDPWVSGQSDGGSGHPWKALCPPPLPLNSHHVMTR